jgi:hypothetical protein
VCGRRRIGKSTLLEAVTREQGGFYWEATRTESPIQLARLGEALGEHLGVGRLALDNWDEAFGQLVRLGEERRLPVVVDEFGPAARVYEVIGGVIGYATDMVDHDLPTGEDDFDRWVADKVLSPAATLHHEATTLLAEDPTLAAANPVILHSILGAIANGYHGS